MVAFREPTTDPKLQAEAERIHTAWNDALAAKDVAALTRLYTEDATIESPLIRYLLGSNEGICRGREAIRAFIPLVFQHQPEERRTYRNPVFTDGRVLMWEYPRETPEGEQMDFVEVMELEDGLIRRHRVYWGWYGVRTLTSGSHSR
jgi:SnoaL-like domain